MFRDSVSGNQDIRYSFILGSGASVTSEVPSGATLVDWWRHPTHKSGSRHQNGSARFGEPDILRRS